MTRTVPVSRVELPGGGYADHTWGLLTENMRTSFRVTLATHGPDATHLVIGTPRLLAALTRRGLVDTGERHRLTPTGRALLRWAANPTNIQVRGG
jgi:hypothetical protein